MPALRLAEADRLFLVGLARAFAGAALFALPMLMTQEMWDLGQHLDRLRLVALLVLVFPLLVAFSRLYGFEETTSLLDDLVDAFVAFFVGAAAGTLVLLLFGIIDGDTPFDEVVAKVSLQAIAGALGAILAMTQLGSRRKEAEREIGYAVHLTANAGGALFLALNVAPTDEVRQIAFLISPWQALLLGAVSLAGTHAFVYSLEFVGQVEKPEGHGSVSVFFRYSVVGYAVALLVSAMLLWVFGRFDGCSYDLVIRQVIVLGFPAALGAAAARLIL